MWCSKLKEVLLRTHYGQSRRFVVLLVVNIVYEVQSERRISRDTEVLTDFPESLLKDPGSLSNITLQVASPVTWLGAGQKIACHTSANTVNTVLKPLCQERGCDYRVVQVNGSYCELYFVGDSRWKDTSVICFGHFADFGELNDQHAFKAVHKLLPVSVREPPAIIIEPIPTAMYRDRNAVVTCRAAIPYVPSSALRWIAFDANGLRLNNLSMSLNVQHEPLVLRITLTPDDLAVIDSLQCEAKLGGVEPFIYQRAAASLFAPDPPDLLITPRDTTLVIGKTAVFTCSAKGYVIGKLQWVVGCRTCRFEQRSETYNASDIYYPETTQAFLTFTITKDWDGVTVSCQPGWYDSLATHRTLRAKRLPILSLIPSSLRVYNGQSVNVRCVGAFLKSSPSKSNGTTESYSQLYDDNAPKLQWTVSNVTSSSYAGEPIDTAERQHEIHSSRSGSMLNFQAGKSWQNRIIACSLVTADGGDSAATMVTVKVRVYNTPSIAIYPDRPVAIVESETSILCVGYGLHVGRLQWNVDCTACDYRVQEMDGRAPSDFADDGHLIALSTKNSSNILTDTKTSQELVLIIRPFTKGQRIVVECSVMGTHGLPVDAVSVKVEDKPLNKALQWAAIPFGTAALFFIVLYVTRKLMAKKAEHETTLMNIRLTASSIKNSFGSTATEIANTIRAQRHRLTSLRASLKALV